MKHLISLLALSIAALGGNAFAEDKPAKPPSPAQAAQQERMKSCNKDATGKTGDYRKAFMKECLSAKAAPTQQNKMKSCNVDAKGKTGDDRKAFMKECLSAKG